MVSDSFPFHFSHLSGGGLVDLTKSNSSGGLMDLMKSNSFYFYTFQVVVVKESSTCLNINFPLIEYSFQMFVKEPLGIVSVFTLEELS